MHTVIIGIGGVGGFFGGKIAHSGQKVTFIARGEHKQAILERGLQVRSIQGDFTTQPFLVTDTVAQLEQADLVLVCTKSWQTEQSAQIIQPILKHDTVVISLQNGADNAERLVDLLGSKHVVGGLCKIYSKIAAPGIIEHFGYDPEIVFGALDGSTSDRLQAVKAVFDKAGFKNTLSAQIHVDIWSKFMFIATISGLGGLTRASIGAMYKNLQLRNILKDTATEIFQIAIGRGVALPENLVDIIMGFIGMQPYESTASTQRDLIEGRPSELDNFNGFIVREGKRLGIDTPTNHFIYACLQPTEEKARSLAVTS